MVAADSFFDQGGLKEYRLRKFKRSNQDTCYNQKPLVQPGEKVKKGQPIADGPCTQQGELALGRNLTVAFMPWGGYNFEDAILVSERLVKDDTFTSLHIEEFDLQVRDTKRGVEEVTREIPNVGEEALANLDEDGIIYPGARVRAGDIMVGKVTPKGETELSPEEKLLRAIFGEKAGDVKDASLKAPPGMDGIVVGVRVFSRQDRTTRSKKEEKRQLDALARRRDRDLKKINMLAEERLSELFAGQTGAPHHRRQHRRSAAQERPQVHQARAGRAGLQLHPLGSAPGQGREAGCPHPLRLRGGRPRARPHRGRVREEPANGPCAATNCLPAWSSWSRSTWPGGASCPWATRWPAATATRVSFPRSWPKRTCLTWPTAPRWTSCSTPWACPAV
jgi:hypothetical protein